MTESCQSRLKPPIIHTPLETWFWFQWNLTIPYDQGWWECQYEVYLRQFHCKNPDLCISQDFKRVLWKYIISRYMTAFYTIFWFFGTFYDGQNHLCDLKVPFSTRNILPKVHFLMYLEKWENRALRGEIPKNLCTTAIK